MFRSSFFLEFIVYLDTVLPSYLGERTTAFDCCTISRPAAFIYPAYNWNYSETILLKWWNALFFGDKKGRKEGRKVCILEYTLPKKISLLLDWLQRRWGSPLDFQWKKNRFFGSVYSKRAMFPTTLGWWTPPPSFLLSFLFWIMIFWML